MQKFTIAKKNGQSIPCIANIPADCKQIVLAIHGMNSQKESHTISQLFADFPDRGLGLLAFDLPAHGESSEPLLLSACLESLASVEAYLAEHFPHAEVLYFASSFGAFVLGHYLLQGKAKGDKAFLRSAALNIPELILGDLHAEPDPAVMAYLEKLGYLETLVDGRPMRLPLPFLLELRQNSLLEAFEKQQPADVQIELVHGTADKAVPQQAIVDFAKRYGYAITLLEGEGHSLNSSPELEKKVRDLAYAFFGLI